MVSSTANITDRPRRRSLAVVLALLWGLYVLLGASGLSARASVHLPASQSRMAAAPPAAPVCHCKMCHGILRGGKLVCCCTAARTPSQQAVITARCDQGAAAALAAVTSWPVVQPVRANPMSLSLTGRFFDRSGDITTLSLSPLPLIPPPCVF